MSVLRACPFCGTEPFRIWKGTCYPEIKCTAFNCPVSPSVRCDEDFQAAAAWNRRTPDYAAGAEAMRVEAVHAATPIWKRGCTCTRCDCGNTDDACSVADWDARTEVAAAIRALPLPEPPPDA